MVRLKSLESLCRGKAFDLRMTFKIFTGKVRINPFAFFCCQVVRTRRSKLRLHVSAALGKQGAEQQITLVRSDALLRA